MKRTTSVLALALATLFAVPLARAVPLQLTHQGRLLDAAGVNLDGPAHFKFAIVDGGRDLNVQATARPTVLSGRIISIGVLSPGAGYLAPPRVTIRDVIGGGSGATAKAQLSGDRVSRIDVLTTGARYTTRATVTLDPPTAPPVFTSFWSHDGSSSAGGMPNTSLELNLTKGLFSVCLGDLNVPGMTTQLTAADLAAQAPLFLRTWVSASGDFATFEHLSPDQKLGSTAFALRAAVAETVPDGAIGVDQIAAGAITGDKIANGTITNNNIAAPGTDQVLVSDGNGNATWMTAGEFLLSQGYTPSLPGIIENLCTIEVDGTFTETVRIVNGPGLQIEDLGGNPGESGLNTEFAIVFDYDGAGNQDLQDWLDTPSNRSGSIIVTDANSTEFFRWNFFEYQLTSIVAGGGDNGTNRYTMTHTLVPNSTVSIQRSNGDWPANVDKRPGDTKVEIDGVNTGGWPAVEQDTIAKTLTMTFDYNEGGGIWQWAEEIARDGTFNRGRKAISLIYEDNTGLEIGRNNFYECFPIHYQHTTGFDLVTKCRERIVISYDSSQGTGPGNALYSPPIVEYFPGTQNMEVSYDLGNNRACWEIEGIQTADPAPPAEAPVILSGPGYEIERIPGFDALGNPDDQSGNNRSFPLVVEMGGNDVTQIADWKQQYESQLPNPSFVKSISLIVKDSTASEKFRWDCYLMFPFDIAPLPNGRSRVTLYSEKPLDQSVAYRFQGNPSAVWGENLQNNPATDVHIEIPGISTLHAAATVDPAERTITINFDYGEGGSLFVWARETAENGSSNTGKSDLTITDGAGGTNYLGCFPTLIQHVSGFEQDIKGKAKVVISYDQSQVPAP